MCCNIKQPTTIVVFFNFPKKVSKIMSESNKKTYYKYDLNTLALYCGDKAAIAPWKCLDKRTKKYWPIDIIKDLDDHYVIKSNDNYFGFWRSLDKDYNDPNILHHYYSTCDMVISKNKKAISSRGTGNVWSIAELKDESELEIKDVCPK